MPSNTSSKPKTALKQSSLQFGSRKLGKAAAESKAKQLEAASSGAVTPVTVGETPQPVTPEVHVVSDDSDIEYFPEADPDSDVEVVEDEDIEEAEQPTPLSSKRGKGRAAAVKKEKAVEEDEIEDIEEEQPPKKKRRTSSRTARASIEATANEDASTSKKKGKQTKSAKSKKSVFRSRDGTENSEPVKEESWEVGSKKISITTKGHDVAGHVDVAAMRKHFGLVREKMGNVKPIHASTQSMEDHILRFFDLSYEYGPCIGVSRLQRWERAEALGLDPPPVVKQLLTNEDGSERNEVKECVFFGDV